MRNWASWCLVVALAFVSEISAEEPRNWDCTTLRPKLSYLKDRNASSPETSPFVLSVKDNTTTIHAGQSVTIGLRVTGSDGEITGFILQARRVGSTEPQGTWSGNDLAEAVQCGEKDKDTVVNRVFFGVKVHDLDWQAPINVPDDYEVQIVGTAINGAAGDSGGFWYLHGNAVLKIKVSTVSVIHEPNQGQQGETDHGQGDDENNNGQVDPQITPLDVEDERDLLLETRMEQEYLQKKEADIAFENLQSEADNSLQEENKRKEDEYKWEMEDYEKKLYEEEVRRQARIDAELRDKEEWEAQQYEEQKRREEEEKRRREQRREMLGDTLQEVDINEIGNGEKKTSAGYRHTSTFFLYTCFVVIIAALL